MSELIDKIVLPIEKLPFIKVVSNGKRPAEKHGFKDGKIGFDVARTLASGYNVGFVMEPDFVAIDMDEDIEKGYQGIKVIEELEKELGKLPPTYTQRTPRGGLHKVFLSTGLKNKSTGKITPAVDVKYSGFVLFHGSCINGRYYQAIDGVVENGKLLFSALPKKWIDYIETTTPTKKSSKKSYEEYQPVVIDGDFRKMYESCNFVRRCVDYSDSLSEPEWHQFARLMNHFTLGESMFIEFSKNHAGFNLEEAKRKFSYAKKYPVNCQTISEVSIACKTCNNLINKEK